MADVFSPSTTVCNTSAICNLCKLESGSWILDSEASDHISFDCTALHNLTLLNSSILVCLPNGNKVQVTDFGKLRLHDDFELHHVLLVPHFKYNLLSVKRLASQLHCEVVFIENLWLLQGTSLKRLGVIGRESFGLYILDKSLMKDAKNLLFSCSFLFVIDFLRYHVIRLVKS